MYGLIRDFVRRKRLKKYASDIQTGLVPLTSGSVVNVLIDVEEPGFDDLKEDIMAWGRRNAGCKVNIYFIDFRRLGKEELLLTSITNTILKRELDWVGMPDMGKITPLVGEKSDILISMVDRHDFPVDFIIRCTKAKFKIGRHKYEGHPFDMIMSGAETAELRSEARQIFAAITEFITKIK